MHHQIIHHTPQNHLQKKKKKSETIFFV